MKVIFVSPHYDDAVLFCGMKIQDHLSRGDTIEVHTIFAAEYQDDQYMSPFAYYLHSKWGEMSPRKMMTTRRSEDVNALSSIGIEFDHIKWYNLKEFIYLKKLYNPLTIGRLSEHNFICSQLYFPLALSGHPDHVLCCDLGLQFAGQVVFYADGGLYDDYTESNIDKFQLNERFFNARYFWRKYWAARKYKSQVKDLYRNLMFVKMLKPEEFYTL